MLSKLNPLSWFRTKPETFTASADCADNFQTQAAPMATSAPPRPVDFAAKVVGSYRYRTATPTARAAMLRSAADSVASKPAATAPLRTTPARSTPAKAKLSPGAIVARAEDLQIELDGLLALATRAVARVQEEKQRRELKGLDLTRAATKIQLAKSGLTAFSADDVSAADVVNEKKNISEICRRSKPSANPAFVPEPSQDVRLRECNDYYREELAEIDAEIQGAAKRGKISQEILSRRRRTDQEWKNAVDKIMGWNQPNERKK